MKIGLVTYYNDLNCGTCLQAYASLKALRTTYPNDDVRVVPFYAIKPPMRPYLHDASLSSLMKDIRRLKAYKRFIKEDIGVAHQRMIIDAHEGFKFIQDMALDKIYVGADTLLELGRTKRAGYDGLSTYWLSPQINAKKYLLAASCGNEEYENLSERQKAEMKATLEDFSGYGVRDYNTARLLAHFISHESITMVPDPTFTLDIDHKISDAYLHSLGLRIKEKAILFHVNRQDIWAKDVAVELKKEGYRIYSLRPATWADVVLNNMSPLEQLGIYRYFTLVITHRFHDSIFCLKNNTPMLLYIPGNGHTSSVGESKFSSLIKQAGLYPINLIDVSKITANIVIDRVEPSIDNFNSHKKDITQYLKLQEKKYWDFLETTIEK